MKIQYDFIDQRRADHIEDFLTDIYFPWFYRKSTQTVYGEIDSRYVDCPILRHAFVIDKKRNSDHINLIQPIIYGIQNMFGNDIIFTKIYANCSMPNILTANKHTIPHVDTVYTKKDYERYDGYTALYYVNDSESTTVFYNEKYEDQPILSRYDVTESTQIKPEKNKFIAWDSRIYHSAPAAGPDLRLVVNFNFLVPKKLL